MSFFITHLFGASEVDPDLRALPSLYDELKDRNSEHVNVSLTHESEWSLGAFASGLLVWENLGEGDPRHMKNVERECVIELWSLLASGSISQVEQQPWAAGYG